MLVSSTIMILVVVGNQVSDRRDSVLRLHVLMRPRNNSSHN